MTATKEVERKPFQLEKTAGHYKKVSSGIILVVCVDIVLKES